jgi:hypothetical protein
VSFICLSLKHFVELLPCTLPVAFNLPGQRLIGVKLSCANPRERWTRYVESIELSCMTKPFNSRCIKLDGTSPKSNARTCLLLWRRDTPLNPASRGPRSHSCVVPSRLRAHAALRSLPRGPVSSSSVSAVALAPPRRSALFRRIGSFCRPRLE